VPVPGTCRLCGTTTDLQESHIIPRSVYAWLKQSSATGFLRDGETPNKREQDGLKTHLLCWDCEQRLNQWETPFYEEVFLPLQEGRGTSFTYGDWLLKFAVSVSWRILTFLQMHSSLRHLAPDLSPRAAKAAEVWKEFLLGDRPHPSRFEQHMLPLGEVEHFTDADAPPNLNRYILRSIDPDVWRVGDRAFVYGKLCRIVLVGFIEMPHPRRWQGTKIHVRGGTLGGRNYSVPDDLRVAIRKGALKLRRHEQSISPRQRDRIEQAYTASMGRFAGSETFRATAADVRLFGAETFRFDPDSEDEPNTPE
jgi:hypothetical protein